MINKPSIQIELFNRGITYKGFILLNYIKETMCYNIIGADLQKENPMFFKDSRDVKESLEELVNTNLVRADYISGNIINISLNSEEILNIMKSNSVVIKKERAKPKKQQEVSSPEDKIIDEISIYYNSFSQLPRPSNVTVLCRQLIVTALEKYSLEEIKNAIKYVSELEWVIDKGHERWCNITWIMKNISNFMEGGKYFKSKQQEVPRYGTYSFSEKEEKIIL